VSSERSGDDLEHDLRDDDDTLLSEALAEHTDDTADAPGCYALDIAVPDAGFETHARRWMRSGYESTPPYLSRIVDADAIVYVGRAASVRDRIEDHLAGDVRTASLPSVYDVRSILAVRWGTNTDHAEQVFADDLRAELGPNAFVHSR